MGEVHALTVWQPWASLIMQGFKPFEFRGWDFREKPALRALVGQRVVIHAATRKLDPYWPLRLSQDTFGADLRATCAGGDPQGAHDWLNANLGQLPFGAGLGTVVLGDPIAPPSPAYNWRWPVSDPQPFANPIPARGFQGFWKWPTFKEVSDG